MNQFSKLLRNSSKTIGASGVQFLITLLTTPVMTRLYEPAAYASFGIIYTAATVLVGVGLLSLPNAYVTQKDATTRQELMKSMVLLLAGLVIFSCMAVVGTISTNSMQTEISKFALVLLPVLVLTYGIRQIMVNVAIQQANFTRFSLAQMIEPVSSRGGSIALGAALGGHPVWIVISVIIGHLSSIFLLLKMMPRNLMRQAPNVLKHMTKLGKILRQFIDFAFFNTVSQQIQPAVMLGIQMGIVAFFSSHNAGQYILAISILSLPATLISLAAAPVVYHHLNDVAQSKLMRHYLLLTGLYFLVAFAVLLPVILFGEEIFSFVFGKIWADAGKIAAIFSVPYIGVFIFTGMQSIFLVTKRLKAQFHLEVITSAVIILVAYACFKMMSFDQALLWLSAAYLLRNLVLISAGAVVAYQHAAVKVIHS